MPRHPLKTPRSPLPNPNRPRRPQRIVRIPLQQPQHLTQRPHAPHRSRHHRHRTKKPPNRTMSQIQKQRQIIRERDIRNKPRPSPTPPLTIPPIIKGTTHRNRNQRRLNIKPKPDVLQRRTLLHPIDIDTTDRQPITLGEQSPIRRSIRQPHLTQHPIHQPRRSRTTSLPQLQQPSHHLIRIHTHDPNTSAPALSADVITQANRCGTNVPTRSVTVAYRSSASGSSSPGSTTCH